MRTRIRRFCCFLLATVILLGSILDNVRINSYAEVFKTTQDVKKAYNANNLETTPCIVLKSSIDSQKNKKRNFYFYNSLGIFVKYSEGKDDIVGKVLNSLGKIVELPGRIVSLNFSEQLAKKPEDSEDGYLSLASNFYYLIESGKTIVFLDDLSDIPVDNSEARTYLKISENLKEFLGTLTLSRLDGSVVETVKNSSIKSFIRGELDILDVIPDSVSFRKNGNNLEIYFRVKNGSSSRVVQVGTNYLDGYKIDTEDSSKFAKVSNKDEAHWLMYTTPIDQILSLDDDYLESYSNLYGQRFSDIANVLKALKTFFNEEAESTRKANEAAKKEKERLAAEKEQLKKEADKIKENFKDSSIESLCINYMLTLHRYSSAGGKKEAYGILRALAGKDSNTNSIYKLSEFVTDISGGNIKIENLSSESASALLTYARMLWRLASKDVNETEDNYSYLALPGSDRFIDLYDELLSKVNGKSTETDDFITSPSMTQFITGTKEIHLSSLAYSKKGFQDTKTNISIEMLNKVLPDGIRDPYSNTEALFEGKNLLRIGYYVIAKALLAGIDIMGTEAPKVESSDSSNYTRYIAYSRLLIDMVTKARGLNKMRYAFGSNFISQPAIPTTLIQWEKSRASGEYNSMFINVSDSVFAALLGITNYLSSGESELLQKPKEISGTTITMASSKIELSDQAKTFFKFLEQEHVTEEFIETWDYTKPAEGLTTGFSRDFINDVISYFQICELLGIKSWIPALDAMSKYSNKVLAIGNSVLFKINNNNEDEQTMRILSDIFEGDNSSVRGHINHLTDYYKLGFAMSAGFIPMKTNLYDVNTWSPEQNEDWIRDFHMRYGFHRKALFIDKDHSSVSKGYAKGTKGTLKVATLRDILNPTQDISLYIDKNCYNAKDAASIMQLSTDKEATGIKFENPIEGFAKDFISNLSQWFSLQDYKIFLKTEGNDKYSSAVKNAISAAYDSDPMKKLKEVAKMGIAAFTRMETVMRAVPTPQAAKDQFRTDEYSSAQTRGLIAAIYYNTGVFNSANAVAVRQDPVFLSSSKTGLIEGVTDKWQNSIYNYILLKNIAGSLDSDVKSTLDMDSPLFMDIYGNIITQSGVVVVPAAANATLVTPNKWYPYTAAWLYYYGKGFKLPLNANNSGAVGILTEGETPDEEESIESDATVEEINNKNKIPEPGSTGNGIIDELSKEFITNDEREAYEKYSDDGFMTRTLVTGKPWFVPNRETNEWEMSTIYVDGLPITQGSYPVNNLTINTGIINIYMREVLGKGQTKRVYLEPTMLNVIFEALRGCPMENLKMEQEGLKGPTHVNQITAVIGGAVDIISKALTEGIANSSPVSIPNPVFISGLEYIILPIIKVLFVGTLLAFFYTLYKEGLKGKIGIMPVLKFFRTVGLLVLAFAMFPVAVYQSYYLANKSLLRNEMIYIGMLNEEKRREGKEVGFFGVSDITTDTKLYVKLEDLTIPWWQLIDDVMFSSIFDSVGKLYDETYSNSEFMRDKDTIKKGTGLYIDIDDVMKSTTMYYTKDTSQFVNSVDKQHVFSYISPYYFILDNLVREVNIYNDINKKETGITQLDGLGHVMVKGGFKDFMLSEDVFPKNGQGDIPYDITGLYTLYELPDKVVADGFGDIDNGVLEAMWYTPTEYNEQQIRDRLQRVEKAGKRFIANNHKLLGRVSDETFLKFLALDMAMEYNRQFDIKVGRSLELLDLDIRDLYRLSVVEKAKLYEKNSLTLGRQIYEATGPFETFLSIFGITIMWLSQKLVLLLVLLIILLAIITVFFRQLLLKKEAKAITGLFITIGLISAFNLVYASFLKLSVNMPDIAHSGVVSVLFTILVQLSYLIALIFIISIQVKDWASMGANRYQMMWNNFAQNFLNRSSSRSFSDFSSVNTQTYGATTQAQTNTQVVTHQKVQEQSWDNRQSYTEEYYYEEPSVYDVASRPDVSGDELLDMLRNRDRF